ncbi:M23 family metallopeptidase [Glutamicibacter nicotianae]|uniref:M23 family metallopeptidase n=1 Tax=Glutamicibacter nicotianae TaxID=37929 RepID=UPI00167F9B1B|nr:M23 family metallopeptidase [Glutamicibacter nicotianae]
MSGGNAVHLRYPFTGLWLVQNSPADRVPSHGTTLLASSYAIDFVQVDEQGRSAPVTARTWLGTEEPTSFFGFGAPILAPCAGTVIAADDSMPDHRARRGLASVGYALTQRQRLAHGWQALAGNHVMIQTGAAVVALCHLKQGSLEVGVGDLVVLGDPMAACGNSGNSTEPHVHVQAIDRLPIERAQAIEMNFNGHLPRNGEIVQIPGAP